MRGRGRAGSVSMSDSRGRGTGRGHSSSSVATSTSASTTTPLGIETIGPGMSTFAGPSTSTSPITLTGSSSSLRPSIAIPQTSHSPGLGLESQPHTLITPGSDSYVGRSYTGSREKLRVHDGR